MDREELKRQALDFLKDNVVAVIATASTDNIPEAATIYYVVDDEFNFYIRTDSDSRKVQNLRSNPQVALVVGTANMPVTVQVQGKIAQVESGEEFNKRGLQLEEASNKGPYEAPLDNMKGTGWVIYKITPTWLRWLDLREPSKERRSPVVLLP